MAVSIRSLKKILKTVASFAEKSIVPAIGPSGRISGETILRFKGEIGEVPAASNLLPYIRGVSKAEPGELTSRIKRRVTGCKG